MHFLTVCPSVCLSVYLSLALFSLIVLALSFSLSNFLLLSLSISYCLFQSFFSLSLLYILSLSWSFTLSLSLANTISNASCISCEQYISSCSVNLPSPITAALTGLLFNLFGNGGGGAVYDTVLCLKMAQTAADVSEFCCCCRNEMKVCVHEQI